MMNSAFFYILAQAGHRYSYGLFLSKGKDKNMNNNNEIISTGSSVRQSFRESCHH